MFNKIKQIIARIVGPRKKNPALCLHKYTNYAIMVGQNSIKMEEIAKRLMSKHDISKYHAYCIVNAFRCKYCGKMMADSHELPDYMYEFDESLLKDLPDRRKP